MRFSSEDVERVKMENRHNRPSVFTMFSIIIAGLVALRVIMMLLKGGL